MAQPPVAAVWVNHGRDRYRYDRGVWYHPAAHGWRVVVPPRGVRVHRLPDFARVVLLGGLTYWVLNDIWYRELPRAEGYEVVDRPDGGGGALAVVGQPARLYVYPRLGQSASVQASDEYECHRWAVRQTGVDPTGALDGSAPMGGSVADYRRAQAACLDARGYEVR